MTNILRRLKIAISGGIEIFKAGGLVRADIKYAQYDNILCGKVVLITGGSSGIGLAIAKKCTTSGATVIITGRNEVKLKEAVATERNMYYMVWDIQDIDNIPNKLFECRELVGKGVDVLVNNAGIPPTKFFGNIDNCEWEKIYNTNLKGTYFLTQEIVKQWKDTGFSGYKKIINISSQGGYVGATYPYRMVKWDIRGLTEGLGKILISDNVIVNGIAPGVVKTSMQEFSLKQGDNLYTNQNPIQRVCLPEEIAELAVFLIADTSNFIIGQTIVCDGGYTLK